MQWKGSENPILLWDGESQKRRHYIRSGDKRINCFFGTSVPLENRNAAQKLPFKDPVTGESFCTSCLLVAAYAWDMASFVGNEYWIGKLKASMDPAAACCSTIPYIQNAEI